MNNIPEFTADGIGGRKDSDTQDIGCRSGAPPPPESTTPPTTIVTFEDGKVFHWQGSCRHFSQAVKKNRYTPCTICSRVKKFN